MSNRELELDFGVFARCFLACFGLLVFTHIAPAQEEKSPAKKDSQATAFVNVTVVPMDRERVLERRTVLVRGGRIAEVGTADKITVPKGARRIDGRGKFLMPGLTDMHVHLKSSHEFALYLANGVTTVYNLSGRPAHLAWRDRIARGETPGPTIYTCGPIIFRCDSAEEARQVVEEQSKTGYDSIKIYNQVSSAAYPVLIETARQKNMLVVGHIPRAPGLEGALKAHQPIAHAEEYIYTFFKDNVDDESRIPEVAAATQAADISVTLTLVNFDHIFRQAAELPGFLARPEMKYLAPWARELWSPVLNFYHPRFQRPGQQQYLKKALVFQQHLTREMNRAGVRVLAGTDAMNPGVVPGFSVLEELDLIAGSGLTPFETLRTATRYPGEFLSPTAEFGTVAVGKRADLLLLDGNPLESLTNLTRRAGVMTRGQWLPEAALQKMLHNVTDAYAREERFAKSRLEDDPKQAMDYFRNNDPFHHLALHVMVNFIAGKGFARFKRLCDATRQGQPDTILAQEGFINDLGLHLLQLNRKQAAIEVLTMNVEAHPQSANAWDSLAEAHLKNGDRELAIQFFRKALEIDPTFPSSVKAMKKLIQ